MQIVKSLLNWIRRSTKPSVEPVQAPEPVTPLQEAMAMPVSPEVSVSVEDKPKNVVLRKKRYYPPKEKSVSSTTQKRQSPPKSEPSKPKSVPLNTSQPSSTVTKLLIVAVFDPLAVLMFIAVNQDLSRKKDIIEPEKIESPDTLITDEIKIEPEIKPKKTRRVRKPKTEWERDRILIPVDDEAST